MPPLATHFLIFAVGVVLLIAGGEVMVRGAVRIARRLGVAPLVIGLTIVAAGTSAPELALNAIAAWRGNPGLSFGNVVGSNIANIGLVVGLGAMLAPLAVGATLIRREMPIMLLVTFGVGALFLVSDFTPASAPPALSAVEGLSLLGAFLVFMGFVLVFARRDKKMAAEFIEEVEELMGDQTAGSLLGGFALFVGGLVLLVGGGYAAERGAVDAATELGVSEEVIGLTIVAVATSLPELATSLAAIRRNQVDLAVGNVVGSNIFNLLLIFGVTALIAPVPLPDSGFNALLVMAGLAVLLVPFSVTHDRTVSRGEGALLLLIYVAYNAWLVYDALSAPSPEVTTP